MGKVHAEPSCRLPSPPLLNQIPSWKGWQEHVLATRHGRTQLQQSERKVPSSIPELWGHGTWGVTAEAHGEDTDSASRCCVTDASPPTGTHHPTRSPHPVPRLAGTRTLRRTASIEAACQEPGGEGESRGLVLGTRASLASAVAAGPDISVHGLPRAPAKIPAKLHAVSLLVFGVQAPRAA